MALGMNDVTDFLTGSDEERALSAYENLRREGKSTSNARYHLGRSFPVAALIMDVTKMNGSAPPWYQGDVGMRALCGSFVDALKNIDATIRAERRKQAYADFRVNRNVQDFMRDYVIELDPSVGSSFVVPVELLATLMGTTAGAWVQPFVPSTTGKVLPGWEFTREMMEDGSAKITVLAKPKPETDERRERITALEAQLEEIKALAADIRARLAQEGML